MTTDLVVMTAVGAGVVVGTSLLLHEAWPEILQVLQALKRRWQ